jgi:hypothetical protein
LTMRALSKSGSLNPRRLLIGSSLAVLGGALIFILARGAFTRAPAERGPRSGADHAPPTMPAIACPSWVEGTKRNYALKMSSEITSSEQALLKFELSGTWNTMVLAANDKQRMLRVSLDQAKFQSEVQPSPAELTAIRDGLARATYVTLDTAGRIVELRKPAGMPPLAEQVVTYVATATQFVCPTNPVAAWQSVETDPSGRYRASYRVESPGNVLKNKLAYVEAFGFAIAGPSPDTKIEILNSLQRYHFDEQARINSLSLKEATRIYSDGPLPKLGSSTELALELRDQSVAAIDPNELAQALALAPTKMGQRPTAPAAKLDSDAARTAGLTLPEALRYWQKTSDADKVERARLFVALSAILRTDPNAIKDALRRILRHDAQSGLLIDALSRAASADAQTALREIAANGRLGGDDKRRAMIALSLTPSPNAETVDWLTKLTRDPALGRQARFALGNAAYQNGRIDPGEAAIAVNSLVGLLGPANPPGDVADTLRALGTAGSRIALPQIEALAQNDLVIVRAAAMEALRRIPGSDVDQLLARTLPVETETLVKESVIGAVKERPFSEELAKGLQLVATSDASVSVRYHAIEGLIRWAQSAPNVRTTLAWSAANDSNEHVRTLASKALANLQERG